MRPVVYVACWAKQFGTSVSRVSPDPHVCLRAFPLSEDFLHRKYACLPPLAQFHKMRIDSTMEESKGFHTLWSHDFLPFSCHMNHNQHFGYQGRIKDARRVPHGSRQSVPLWRLSKSCHRIPRALGLPEILWGAHVRVPRCRGHASCTVWQGFRWL